MLLDTYTRNGRKHGLTHKLVAYNQIQVNKVSIRTCKSIYNPHYVNNDILTLKEINE